MTENLKIAKNQAGYDRWSSFYDASPNPTVAIDERYFPSTWAHLNGRDILEIGCGTGRHTVKLAEQGNRVTAIDLSEGMLEVARSKLKEKSVHLVQGDFISFEGFLENSFDAVVTSLVIEHIQDLSAFFLKVKMLLKNSGSLFLSEIHPSKALMGGRAYFQASEAGERTYLESHPHQSGDFLAAAKVAGLCLVEDVDVYGDAKLADTRPEWNKYLGKPIIKMWVFEKCERTAHFGL